MFAESVSSEDYYTTLIKFSVGSDFPCTETRPLHTQPFAGLTVIALLPSMLEFPSDHPQGVDSRAGRTRSLSSISESDYARTRTVEVFA